MRLFCEYNLIKVNLLQKNIQQLLASEVVFLSFQSQKLLFNSIREIYSKPESFSDSHYKRNSNLLLFSAVAIPLRSRVIENRVSFQLVLR